MPVRKQTRQARQYLIFISHSSRDRWIARQMAHVLEEQRGRCAIRTFLDEKDIQGGDPIAETIRRSIVACDEFLVLLSQNSISRPWVLLEMGVAFGFRKRIVAIVDKVSANELPDILVPYKAIDLNDFDDYVRQAVVRARKALERSL
jgi:hypothetical protein